MPIVIEKVKKEIEEVENTLTDIWRKKEQNLAVSEKRLQTLNKKIDSLASSIKKATTGEQGKELRKHENYLILKELLDLSNHQQKLWREIQLLKADNSEESKQEFKQALWWFSEQGGRDELAIIQTVRANLVYDEPKFRELLEEIQKKIEEKLFTSEVYQVFCSRDQIEELSSDIVIIENYESFLVVSVEDEQIITHLKDKYPVEKILELTGDTGKTSMFKKEQIVKFKFPVRNEWKDRLEETGVIILEPLGNSEFAVSIPNQQILDQIKKFREVAQVTPYEPTIRVQEEYLEGLGDEITEEMLIQARLKIDENPQNLTKRPQIIPGILIARFFTKKDRDEAVVILKKQNIKVIDQPDNHELVVDLIAHSKPKLAYEFIKHLEGLASLEEETLESTCNNIAVPLIKNGVSPIQNSSSVINPMPELTGRGEIIAIADTGLDTGDKAMLHPDFQGRVRRLHSYPIRLTEDTRVYNPGDDDGASDKYSGHGTHVAGSVLGSGKQAQKEGLQPIQGMAPEAELIFQAVEQTPKWTLAGKWSFLKNGIIPPASDLLGIPRDLQELFQDAYTYGARIHSNSWGGGIGGSYNRRCRQLDEFVWQHKDFLIVFAAGNEGNEHGSVTPPGTAKNCLTVGASENDRAHEFSDTYGKWMPYNFRDKPLKSDGMVDSINDIAAFSSRGPCKNGRRKPDVVAPGTFILSTRSCQIAHNADAPYTPAIAYYMYMSGTSMATPLVAGSAALVREYLRTQREIENPSAALLKAALIHSAEYSKYCYAHESSKKWADNEQGWGRINLSRIINPSPPYHVEFIDRSQGFSETGQEHNYRFEITKKITARSIPLRVTLVYTDHPGFKLVNNLNLLVYSPKNPTSKTYIGNYFEGSGQSVNLDHLDKFNKSDKLNNVEGCIIELPEPGNWRIQIVGAEIKVPSQDYALVISGAIANWQSMQ